MRPLSLLRGGDVAGDLSGDVAGDVSNDKLLGVSLRDRGDLRGLSGGVPGDLSGDVPGDLSNDRLLGVSMRGDLRGISGGGRLFLGVSLRGDLRGLLGGGRLSESGGSGLLGGDLPLAIVFALVGAVIVRWRFPEQVDSFRGGS